MIARIESAACAGVQALSVQIEVDVGAGLPQMLVVGLPDASVKEAKERVRAAIKNSGFRFPPDKITVNLAPADLKKEGPAFDLPIALGILAAGGVIPPENLSRYVFLGELALDGSLRPFRGALVLAQGLPGGRAFVFPKANAEEAALEKKAVIHGADTLQEVVEFLQGKRDIPRMPAQDWRQSLPPSDRDFSEIRGQHIARRAAEVAVAGGHNLLLIGSPGSGKSMLANRIPSIMPPLSFPEMLEITKIYSVAGTESPSAKLVERHPFRSPHHAISPVAMSGGGSWPRPGEISLAHGGVLFLDEFPEFRRDVLETLRAPLEEGAITISRAKSRITFPCRMMLVAAMNPCPCGYLGDRRKTCRCSMNQIQKYRSRISGPILDRIDLHIEVQPLSYEHLNAPSGAESSEEIRKRVVRCRTLQSKRYKGKPFKLNAHMSPREIRAYASPDAEGKKLLERALEELHLSARGYFKILKVARTLADLEDVEVISSEHIAEAIQYRTLDRQWPG